MSAEDNNKNLNNSERTVIADSRNSGTDESESTLLKRDTRRDGKIDIGLDFNYDSDVANKKARMKNASGKGVRPVTTYIAPDEEDALLDFFAPPELKEDLLVKLINEVRESNAAAGENTGADRYAPADTIEIDKSVFTEAADSGKRATTDTIQVDKFALTDTIQIDKLAPTDTIQIDKIEEDKPEESEITEPEVPEKPELPEVNEEPQEPESPEIVEEPQEPEPPEIIEEPEEPEPPEIIEEPEVSELTEAVERPQVPEMHDDTPEESSEETSELTPEDISDLTYDSGKVSANTIWLDAVDPDALEPHKPSLDETIMFRMDGDEVPSIFDRAYEPETDDLLRLIEENIGPYETDRPESKGLKRTGDIDLSEAVKTKGLGGASDEDVSEAYGLPVDPLAELKPEREPIEANVPTPEELWTGFTTAIAKYAGLFTGKIKDAFNVASAQITPPALPEEAFDEGYSSGEAFPEETVPEEANPEEIIPDGEIPPDDVIPDEEPEDEAPAVQSSESYGLTGDSLAELTPEREPIEANVPTPEELWTGFKTGVAKYAEMFTGKVKDADKAVPAQITPPALPEEAHDEGYAPEETLAEEIVPEEVIPEEIIPEGEIPPDDVISAEETEPEETAEEEEPVVQASESYGLTDDPLAEYKPEREPIEANVPTPEELWTGFKTGVAKYTGLFAGKVKDAVKAVPALVTPPALPENAPAAESEPVPEDTLSEETILEEISETADDEISDEEPLDEDYRDIEDEFDDEIEEESEAEPEDEQTLEELVRSDDACSRKMLVLSGALTAAKGKTAKIVNAGSSSKSRKEGGKSAAKKKAVSKAKESDAAKAKYKASEAARNTGTAKTAGSGTSAGPKGGKKPIPLSPNDFKKAKPKKRRKGRIRTFFGTIFAVMILLIFIGGCAGVAYVGYTVSQADPIQPKGIYDTLETTTYIYDDKGKLVDEVYYSENRQITTYDQLPENLKNAFIAVEDKTFWTHKGFNFRRIIGAVIEKFHGGSISGTSTITQQLARNVFLPEEKSIRSIKRKITEMYYAYEIEEELSKEDILTAYLNTIYLGYGCYGVDTAARTYFNKNVEDLTLEQCAALAALPQAPGTYQLLTTEEGEYTTKIKDGLYANDISKERRDMILSLMQQQGYITEEEREAATRPLADFIKPGSSHEATSKSAFKDYLIEVVRADLMKTYELTEEQADKLIYTKGLRIYSTLDSQAQRVINKQFANKDNFPTTVKKGVTPEAAMVIAEVGTGKIKAMVGTRKVTGQMLFNRATNPRQPGSSIKPLTVYSAALQKSYELQKAGKKYKYVKTGYDKQGTTGWGDYITTTSLVRDERMKVNGKVWPQNATRSYSGNNTFRTAMYKSINTCAVKILAQVGIDYSMDMLHKYGITTAVDDTSQSINDYNLAALGLGAMTQGVTPLDMAIAYTVFPNGGVRYSPTCYTKVEDSNGKVLLEAKAKKTKVLNPGVAWIMTNVLEGDVKYGIAGNARIDGTSVGGKTGTTNDQYDIWFDGFTPKYAAALWIGTDQNVEMNSMSEKAAALWSKIMSRVKRAQGGSFKSQPDNVIYWYGDYYTRGTQPPAPKPKEEKKDDKKSDKKDTDKKTTEKTAATIFLKPQKPKKP